MTREARLRAHLESLIARRGQIPFSDYMESVLYHPELGYYSQERNPIGPEGDFYTSVNVDPAFGQLLVRLFEAMETQIRDFTLVELGAGTGELARHILETRRFPYRILERSRAMRARQQKTLAGFDVGWIDTLPDRLQGCVFSNEFFDALPVRRFVRRGGVVRELCLGPGLREVESEPDPPVDLPLLEDGCEADLSDAAIDWIRRIGRSIGRGYHVAVDYGYLREALFRQKRGTLMCYRRHVADEDPYENPGEKDMTSHVNFSDLIEAGREVGLDRVGFRSQKDFLIDLGLLGILEPLAGATDPSSIRRLQALKTLILPPMLGERFQVLLQEKGMAATALPGFR